MTLYLIFAGGLLALALWNLWLVILLDQTRDERDNAKEEGRKYGRTCGRPNGRGGVVKSCGNCRHYALAWHERTLRKMQPIQGSLFAQGDAA